MTKNISKSGLAVALSKLKGFVEPKVRVEQYATDPEIAAEVLWNAYMLGDIGKVSVDLGCGTGMLGLGALMLGAKKVYFVDNDQEALAVARQNCANLKSEDKAVFRCQDVSDFNEKADVVFQNPPFGTKVRHADKIFLEKAMGLAKTVYSFHKTSTKSFVESICRDHNFRITHRWDFNFPLKATQRFHTRKIHRINVSCFRIAKK